jgi:hypothetical protein
MGASKGTVRTTKKLLKLWPYKTSYVPSAVILRSVIGPMFYAETIATVGHYRRFLAKWQMKKHSMDISNIILQLYKMPNIV